MKNLLIALAVLALGAGLLAFDAGGEEKPGTGKAADLYPMARIAPGQVTMGSEGDGIYADTRHTVRISRPFLMGTHEVTEGLWRKVMGNLPESAPADGCGDSCPVTGLTWFEAVSFADRLSEREGLTPCYITGRVIPTEFGRIIAKRDTLWWDRKCTGYRLPTEAEWEYAAKASGAAREARESGQDDYPADTSALENAAWYRGNSGVNVETGDCVAGAAGPCGRHPVGMKTRNSWALFDMTGNAREWTWDWFKVFQAINTADPEGPDEGIFRVVRGCHFKDAAENCDPSRRFFQHPSSRSAAVGFRLVRSAR